MGRVGVVFFESSWLALHGAFCSSTEALLGGCDLENGDRVMELGKCPFKIYLSAMCTGLCSNLHIQ